MDEDPEDYPKRGVLINPTDIAIDNLQTFIYQNFSILVNGSKREGDDHLLRKYSTNRRFEAPITYSFIIAYAILIVVGTIGNCLVVSAVIRKATMRTARNCFIVNLAVSDLLLCVITMPLTLMEILTQYWPLGSTVFLCKLFGSLQATSIFVSTISITAIALDRYHVIVYPTRPSVQRVGAVVVLALIWLSSCVLAAPLFIWRRIKHVPFEFPEYGLDGVDFCMEDWPSQHGRAYYSIFTIIIQYVLPITVVSVAYARICRKLRYRMRPGTQVTTETGNPDVTAGSERAGRQQRDNNRVRKTNTLLISIAIIFGVSWMPLNVLNVYVDLKGPADDKMDTFLIIYAICHMIGMSSACSNPLLYGWLNENFRKEFKDIWNTLRSYVVGELRDNNNLNQDMRGSHVRGRGGVDREPTTVHFKKAGSPDDGDLEQSTLITQVLDRHK